MAAGAAGPPFDGFVKGGLPVDPFRQADLAPLRRVEAQPCEPGPSRSASINSKIDLSVTLSSPSTTSMFAQMLEPVSPHLTQSDQEELRRPQSHSIFFLRSDADSLKQTFTPLNTISDREPPAPSTLSQVGPTCESPDQVASASSSTQSSTHGSSEPMKQPAFRPGRPTLTRLKTSEMLRSQTSTALELGSTQPAANRKSPTGLRLQLDTSVPRRSATLSSYPHARKSRQKDLTTPSLPLATLPTPVGDHARAEARNRTELASPVSSTGPSAESNSCRFADQRADAYMERSERKFQDIGFEVSTILPDFLYLGPDVQNEADVAELQAKGVRRILNVACEIDERGPLNMRGRFDRYLKLPMLDNVEAKGVLDSIKAACSFLDDARLRSEPVYVHCKAGKSRSVTIVIAYLIHALRWSLQRSYSHVVEKRVDISPNIGFVAELMRFEEQELNLSRSKGIYGDSVASTTQSPISKSSPDLSSASAWGEQQSKEQRTMATELTPSLPQDTHEASTSGVAQECAASNTASPLGGCLSQSSPNLSSLASGI